MQNSNELCLCDFLACNFSALQQVAAQGIVL